MTFWIRIALGLAAMQPGAVESVAAGSMEMPVLAWMGPPPDQTTLERYRELAEAGFNHSFSWFRDAGSMAVALEVAREAGVKLLICCPELRQQPEDTVRRFMEHPATGGYYLRDEPGAADFESLGDWVRRIRAVDDVRPCYINLFPTYASPQQLGTETYREHVTRFLAEVPVQILSFDHYPIVGDRLRADWYENLEIIAAAAKGAGKPFWAFALAVAHDPYPVATVDGMRLQVFSNLAYGARAIQYFTYWTPTSRQWNFHRAPIEADGTRTEVHDRVRQVNEELQRVAPVFLRAEVVEVWHAGDPVPLGTRRHEPVAPLVELDTAGRGAVISRLRGDGYEWLAVVNRGLREPMELRLRFDPSVPVQVRSPRTEFRPVEGGEFVEDVSPGDLRLFEWSAR